MDKLREKFGPSLSALSADQFEAYRRARAEVYELYPPPRSTFDKYVEHLLYVLELVGPDHVGIGADWDGGGGVNGMADVAAVPKITDELIRAGYSPQDIAKIWSGNLLRLMREVEAAKSASLDSPDILR